MSEWKKVRLGDVAEILTGYPFDGHKYTDHGIRVVRGENVSTGFLRWDSDKRWADEFDFKYSLREKDIVFGMDGSRVGKNRAIIRQSDLPMILAQRVACVRAKNEACQHYLYYCIFNKQFESYIDDVKTGSTIPHISSSQLHDFEIPFPPLPTQRKIAAVLGALDDKIENNRKICANLEAQAQAIFKSWFVDFDPFGGKMPQGWKMGKLGDVGNIVGGATPSKAKAEFYTEEGIAWLTPKDLSLQQTKFVSKGEIDITEEGYKSASVRMLPKGSVLFSSRAPIGYVAIAKNELCTNQGFKSVVPFDWVGSEFVYQLLRMMTPVIEERASGSTFKEISSSGMKELPVIVPSKNVLHEFSSITLPMGESQKSLEDETRVLAEMRDALLPKLMSGEIDVEKVKVA